MPDNLGEKRNQRLALPVGKIKIPKFLYIILIGLVILILVISGLYFYLKNSKNNLEISLSSKSGGKSSSDYVEAIPSGSLKPRVLNSKTELSNSEIIQSVLDRIDLQKNDNGVYDAGLVCQKDFNNCQSLGESHYSGIPMIWGKFNYFIKNNDQKMLYSIKTDIDNYFEMVKTKTIGTNSDGCRLLYDLWKSENIDEAYKGKIVTICSKFEYPDFFDYERNKKSGDDLLKDIDQKIGKILEWKSGDNVNISEEYVTSINELGFNFNFLPSFMSDYLVQSKMSNSDFLKTRANKIFDLLLEDLPSKLNSPTSNSDFICRVGKSSLDFNLINGDGKSLELAKKLAQIGFEGNNINCALLASRLEILDNVNKNFYSNYKNDFLNVNINNNFSNLGFSEKIDDGFNVDVGFNGLMVGLLSQ